MKECKDCKQTKDISEFYKSTTHSQSVMVYCRRCFNARCQKRWVQRKVDAINLLGGQCTDCAFQLGNSHYSVFEFHHLDPSVKDVDWSKLRLRTWAATQQELTKCVLLCANCHRIRHANARSGQLAEE